MRRPNKLLEKKYISSLVVAAFLALSVLTANNIRMGENRKKESATEAKETLSRAGSERESGDLGAAAERDESLSDTGAPQRSEHYDDRDDQVSDKEQRNRSEENIPEDEEEKKETTSERSSEDYSYDGKAKLTWPVLGNVILPYSMDTTVYYTTLDQYACNDGLLIAAGTGAKVKAAADGRIVDIEETDRYGTVVTMLIGKYYKVFYGQMDDVNYQIGDEVKEGKVIGTVAEPTRSFMLEGPHLYFKMTYKGKSINPADYLR